ncbi:hypothetical protein GCM10012279_42860 [Micromonospora yangpuensis]|uniref:Uncharacterized protein n=1 Tax=Micromonospora yangpuensis TaxID=683228 RepID=A0A1C6TY00_9ACTN|nr:hypothetical protein GCM10012279_42860 [Micromonospora yangpuensis]SCL46627.1 hypothetical protein GA0070617_0334 [Micromonospora yangpuensis]
MARHAKNPTRTGPRWRLWPFTRRRASPLDRLGQPPSYATPEVSYRAVGVARVVYLPEPLLLTLAGEYRAGCWS